MLRPTSRLNSADLPTFGRPTIETEPALSSADWAGMVMPTLTQFRVRVTFGGKLPHPVAQVDHAGDEGEESSPANDVDQRGDMHLQHDPRDLRHLQDRRHFARPARPHPYLAI